MRISDLYVYPIKSCRGISLDVAQYEEQGIRYDRQWMIIDKDSYAMLTARQHTKLVLITPHLDLEQGLLRITIPFTPPAHFDIPIIPPEATPMLNNLTVWGSTDLTGYLCSPLDSPLQLAISKFIDRPSLLVCKGPGIRTAGGTNFVRDLELHVEYRSGNPANVNYADGFPFLFSTEASLLDLREKIRLGHHVNGWNGEKWAHEGADLFDMVRFRPNVVIENEVAWEEDGWAEIDLGNSRFLIASRCTRCPLPNVDPETGEKDAAVPLRILETFRKVDSFLKNKTCFGVNAIPTLAQGTLKVGDTVTVIKKFETWQDDKGKYIRPEDGWGRG